MCIGPFKLVCHWGPLIAIGIVKCICLASLHCLNMWWPPTAGLGGLIHVIIFTAWNGLVLYNFFSAMFLGPGYVPLGWKPDEPDDVDFLQYCSECKGYKAPRAHHCRKCRRCVLKMDHHCPWINNCCGFKNQANFIYFLFFAVCGCTHACVILSCSLYRAIYRTWYFVHNNPPFINLGLQGFILSLFSLGLAIGVIIAVGVLCIIQMKCVIKNETGIESWILDKAKRPRPDGDFVHPYHLGWQRNLKETFCRKEEYDDDEGIYWPVIEGCNQYTLTVEQIQQKNVKKTRVKEYTIIEKYSGAMFPVTKGLRVACTPPFSDEPRIPLESGDKVWVSRWKRNWLYGEKIRSTTENAVDQADSQRVKGWFPRRCAVEIINGTNDSHHRIIDKKSKKKD